MSTPITGAKSSIGGTALQLITASTPITYGTTVKAASANTGKVYVGLAGVTANSADGTDGLELSLGEAVTLPPAFAANANLIYVIGSASGQKVFFAAV